MFKFLKHIAPRTKILFVAFMLILLPGAIISYLSLQSIKQKAENLRIKHNGTVSLLRDKLENDISRLVANFQSSLSELSPEYGNAESLKAWLRDIESENPAFKNLFLVNTNHGLITSSISLGWDRFPGKGSGLNSRAADAFKRAEKAEFIDREFAEAIRMYREALEFGATPRQRALMISRIGRCFFKHGKYRSAAKEYEKILEPAAEGTTIGNVPSPVVAYTQILECYKALGTDKEYAKTLLGLFEYLLDHPWDLEDGAYLFYLQSVREIIQQPEFPAAGIDTTETHVKDLLEKEKKLQEQIRFIRFINQNILSEIEFEIDRGFPSGSELHNISREIGDTIFQLSYFTLNLPDQKTRLIAMGFQFDLNHILEVVIPEILASVDLGEDILVGILSEKDSILYLEQDLPSETYLVKTNFSQHFSRWKVALFDPDGKTIQQLTSREKQIYLALFIGIIAVMLIGITLMVYSVIHESEISRLKSEFVSNVSHELKTPLTLIRMFGETLDSGIEIDQEKQQEFYRIIRTESERLTHLINNVLDFSRMDAGMKEYNMVEVDLVESVRKILEAYRFQIGDNGFVIESELPDDPIILKIDSDAISQVLLNLLNNAVKYSDKNKYIRVKVWRNSDYAAISVTDHGIGISKAELAKIFDKFYRVPGARTLETRGSGLGLTLAKHIVEAHGGTIEVESEEGKGSIFTVRLFLI